VPHTSSRGAPRVACGAVVNDVPFRDAPSAPFSRTARWFTAEVNQPVLIGRRLRCEPLRAAHTDGVVDVFADPASSRFLARDLSDPDRARESVTWRLAYEGPDHLGHWAFVHEDQVIGVGHLRPSAELPSDLIETGWFLNPRYGRRGLATEAAGLLTDYALGAGGVPAVWALIREDNTASLTLAARRGYLPVGHGEHYGGPAPHPCEASVADLARRVAPCLPPQQVRPVRRRRWCTRPATPVGGTWDVGRGKSWCRSRVPRRPPQSDRALDAVALGPSASGSRKRS
jgi:RimJ/RimL family protein N-acetyltransferase